MRNFIFSLGFLLASISFTATASAEIDAEKKAVINEFIEISNANKTASLMADEIVKMTIEQQRRSNPNVPDKFLKVVEEETKATFEEAFQSGSFTEMLYPVYDKHFTTEELKDIITFYKTPTGAKTLLVMPAMMQESIKIGQEWTKLQIPTLQKNLQDRITKEYEEEKAKTETEEK